MGYLGNTPENQAFTPRVDFFSGNASATAFTLSFPVASVAQVQATIENVPQNPGDAYTVSGNTITFTSAPPSGTNNIYVYYTSPITSVITPGYGTVGTAQLQSGLSFSQWVTSGANISYTTGNVGIGTSSPGAKLDVQVSSGNTIARFQNTVSGSGLGEIILAAPNRPAVRTNYQTSVDSNGFFNYDSSEFIWFADSGGSAVERGRFDSSGNFRFNSGYGSVATAYGCRAWVNFNGTGTPAIRGSGNVSSITDNNTGDYTINFTTAMPDANYSLVGSGGNTDNSLNAYPAVPVALTTTTARVGVATTGGSGSDRAQVCVAIFR
jgi:hypothetical protein